MNAARRSWGPPLLLAAALTGLVFWLCSLQPPDPDTWWHVRTGQMIVETRHIPRTDPYSYVLDGGPWVTFEWLSEVLFYFAKQASPAAGLGVLAGAVCAAAALGFWALGGAGAWSFTTLALVLLSRHGFLQQRPQIFDYLFLPLALWLCRRGDRPRRAHWLILPAVAALWANLHGGAAFIAAGLAALRAAIEWRLPGRGGRKSAEAWALLSAACAAAVLVNPHGWSLIGHTGGTILFKGREAIGEWQAFRDPVSWDGAFLAAGAAAIAYGWREEPLLAAAAAAFGVMTLSAVRHAFLFELVLAALAARTLQRLRPLARSWKTHAAAAAALACACVFLPWRLAEFRPIREGLTIKLPDHAVQFLDDHDVQGRMFHSYELGGYLIARCWPRRKVFVDGRNVEYGPDFIALAIRWFVPAIFERLDAQWRFDYAILANGQAYNAEVFDRDKRWVLVFWDDAGLVYLKHEPRNEALIKRFGYDYLRPNQPDFGYLLPLLGDKRIAPKVLAELDRSVASSPESVNAREMRSFALDALGRGGDALAELTATVRLFPEKPGPYMSLGWWYERHDRLAEARDAYASGRWAARRQRDYLSQAYIDNNLAMVEARLGHQDEAVKLLHECLGLMPTHPRALANLSRLEGR